MRYVGLQIRLRSSEQALTLNYPRRTPTKLVHGFFVPIAPKTLNKPAGARSAMGSVAAHEAGSEAVPATAGHDLSTRSRSRRALSVTSALALAGSLLGVVGIHQGLVTGLEIALILSLVLFASGALVALVFFPRLPLQFVATASIVYYTFYLCTGPLIVAVGSESHLHIYIYLVWFFPLLAYNKLVNAPITGANLSKVIRAAPFLVLLCLAKTLLDTYSADELMLLGAYSLAYLAFGTSFGIVTRHREDYLVAMERAESLSRIEQLAYYDTLTGLPNRSLFRERLAEAIAKTTRDGEAAALLLVNLDDFRTPNDTLGPDVGDVLLGQAAARLKSCTGDGDTIARLGGDEFVVMLESLGDETDAATNAARAVGERIQTLFRSPYHLGNFEYSGSVTVGIVLFAGADNTVDELLSHMGLAMHRAKSQGRSMLCFFDPSMQTIVAARASLLSDLRRAIQSREFELHYQPVVDGRGRALGAEALLRWKHPVRGMVPPSEFIPLAEESGLIGELGRWALETACAQLAKWASGLHTRELTIAVNVSLREMLDANFVSIVLDVLQASGADPRKLRLEITESCAMMNAEDTIAKMTLLKEHFVGFSIDDFGTGYSSLAYLKRLPLDILKVDRSFVSDVLTDPKDASIVRTIIALGQSLNLTVVAEGVETEYQRAFLAAEGCDSYQGFLFSPALGISQFETFVGAQLSGVRNFGR